MTLEIDALSVDESNPTAHVTAELSGPAADQLVNQFYPELRRIAASRMRTENARHTWQPTALLNELYLELRKVRTLRPVEDDDADGKAAFMRFAAVLMKRLLIHHARPKSYQAARQTIAGVDERTASFDNLQEMEWMLERLGQLDPLLQDVVQLRIFEGLTVPEIAERLGCSVRSVARHWNFARHWLQREMGLV